MFVKPGQQQDDPTQPLVVRGPNGRLLAVDGEDVPEINFWHRRLRDGDVVLVDPAPNETPSHTNETPSQTLGE